MPSTRRLMEWISLGLTLPVYFYSGAPFLRATFRSLRDGVLGMDALVSIGSGAALAYSVARCSGAARCTSTPPP